MKASDRRVNLIARRIVDKHKKAFLMLAESENKGKQKPIKNDKSKADK